MAKKMIKVSVVGATGYTGVELLRLLSRHPAVELLAVTSRKLAGQPVSGLFPNLRGVRQQPVGRAQAARGAAAWLRRCPAR